MKCRAVITVAISSVLLSMHTFADEAAILRGIKAFFDAPDADSGAARAARKEIVDQILADPDYDRLKVHDWLHKADLFAAREPGRITIAAPTGAAAGLSIVVRIPKDYDAKKPWPLIYALHGTGGSGDDIVPFVEKLLGDDAEQYVIAAPSGYQQVVIHATEPYAAEHAAVLREIKRNVHIDSDRVYAIGYSRGGHACWTLAVLNADQFAGIVPLAGTLILQEYEKLFDVFLPNAATTRILCCWGKSDTAGTDMLSRSPQGGIAGLNRVLFQAAEKMKLPVAGIEDPEKGHGGITPPSDALHQVLSATRGGWPKKFEHTFRVLDQGAAHWIESHALDGALWNKIEVKVEFKPGENSGDPAVEREAVARAIRGMLCRVQGEFDGQKLKVVRKKVTDLTVWIGDGMIDFEKPVALTVNGDKAFDGKVEPDLLLCLTQAKRTYDFERLRWSGLQYKSGKKATVLRGEEM